MSVRLGARFGPELLASILAVVVVIVAVLVFIAARGSGSPTAVVPPGPTASSTPGASTPGASTATPTPSPTPDTAAARVVLQGVNQLVQNRSDLAAAVAARRPSAQDIADRLRAVNATLITLQQPLADLRRDAAMADLAARIGAASDKTRDAVADAQRASFTNVSALKAGGQTVLDVMKPFVALRAELLAIVGPIASP